MNKDNVSTIKKSVVAIGLIDIDRNPIRIVGSGFYVHSDEYIVTASHVIDSCERQRSYYKKEKNQELWLSLFNYVPEGDEYRLVINPFEKYQYLGLKPKLSAYDVNLDIAVLQPKEVKSGHDYLPVSTRRQFPVLEEIYVCGYPGGKTSFNPNAYPTEVSLSPVIQYGRIAALKPADNATTHQGIITDIVGVGGSSGSPILDDGGEVIGIAQSVIPGKIYDGIANYTQTRYILNPENKNLIETEILSKASVKGHVNEGLIYGFSSTMFYGIEKYAKDILQGKPIPKEFQANYATKVSED